MVWRKPTQNGSPGFTVVTSAKSSARTLSVCTTDCAGAGVWPKAGPAASNANIRASKRFIGSY